MESGVTERLSARTTLSGGGGRGFGAPTRPGDHSELSSGTRWHVLQTRTRQEKALGEVLEARGISFFLPLVKRVAYHGGRRRIVETPLFSGYLFLQGSLDDSYFAISTKRVARAVPVLDQERLKSELAQIRFALSQGGVLDPYPYLTRGRRACVVGGPFRGLEGVVESRMREDRLALQVHTLGRETSLEIDASLLEPLD